jgi:hypothetical protein
MKTLNTSQQPDSLGARLGALFSLCVKRTGKMTLLVSAMLAAVNGGHAQSIADFGVTAPTPGINDQSSLTSTANSGNYVDNQRPGQSFTVGANSLGYVLTDLYLQEANGTAGGGQPLTQYVMTNAFTIVQGNWIRVTGLTNVLAPNGVYGFSINRNGGGGWWTVRVDATQQYAGGTHGNFPAGSGTIATATSDMAFSASLTAIYRPTRWRNHSLTADGFCRPDGELECDLQWHSTVYQLCLAIRWRHGRCNLDQPSWINH